MKNIIFIAPPAAGKGTQSDMLCKKYNYIHISTGDILREVAQSDTELSKIVKDTMDKGLLVSDDVMLDLVKEKLESVNGSFILDGFPRNLEQAKFLDSIIKDDYVVIYLDLSQEDAIKRIEGRLTCSCGRSYNLNNEDLKPKVSGICDDCGKALIKRDDDNIDAFKVRFETFINNTKDLKEYYESNNKLVSIDVNRSALDIFESICKEVSND